MPKVVLHKYDPSNTPNLAAYSKKNCGGTWTIRVEDQAAQDQETRKTHRSQEREALTGANLSLTAAG